MNIYDIDGNEIGLREICNWWMEAYPEDVFVDFPKPVVKIRNEMKEILKLYQRGLPK